MFLVPKVMSTQHPDNATPAPFADDAGVLKGEGEVDEAVSVFEMGCDEQMWDSEGKEADSQVVRKLLTNYPDFFQNGHQLGRDMALTLRVPNPRIERDMRKSMVEALQSVPSSWDMARSFYGEGHAPPIQEVILPLTTSAEDLSMVEAYYRKVIVGQEDQTLLDGRSVKDWVGEFLPKTVRVIPLIEDMEHLLDCDGIVEEYLRDRDLPHQRVFLARSDPALTYGSVSAELILKVALLRLHNLEDRLGLPLYPIIGGRLRALPRPPDPRQYRARLRRVPHGPDLHCAVRFQVRLPRENGPGRHREDTCPQAGRACAHSAGARPPDNRQDDRRVPVTVCSGWPRSSRPCRPTYQSGANVRCTSASSATAELWVASAG